MKVAPIYIYTKWKNKKLTAKLILQAGVGQKSDLKSDQGQPKHLIKYKGKGGFFLGKKPMLFDTTMQNISDAVSKITSGYK